MYVLRYDSNNGRSINFSPQMNLVISNTDGLTSNNVQFATTQGINQAGTTIRGSSVQDKTIVVDGSIMGPSRLFRKQLIDTIVPGIGGRLIFDNTLFLDVEPEVTPDISRHSDGAQFQFSLRAGYPYWRALQQSATTLAGVEPMFSFPVNYGDPSVPDYHIFGQRVEESYRNVQNLGNVPVPFVVKFRAVTQLKNPKIMDIETLKYIRVEKTMNPGDTIIVNMTGQTLKVTGGRTGTEENLFAYFDISSTVPFLLRQGDNLIRYDADEGRTALECTIFHHTTTAGAYGSDNVFV